MSDCLRTDCNEGLFVMVMVMVMMMVVVMVMVPVPSQQKLLQFFELNGLAHGALIDREVERDPSGN